MNLFRDFIQFLRANLPRLTTKTDLTDYAELDRASVDGPFGAPA